MANVSQCDNSLGKIMKYKIQRMANIKAPDGAASVYYEVWEVFEVDGEERSHRNADLAFKTKAEAQAGIDKQDGQESDTGPRQGVLIPDI